MSDNKLYHHGVKGQKWGVRRYQNKDGSLTPAGEKRMARLNARKTADELKAKRKARKLSEEKTKQDMKQDVLDRKSARKLSEEKTKQDMKQDILDRESARKITSKNAYSEIKNESKKVKAEVEATKIKAKTEDLYDLPDDPSVSTQRSTDTGKKLLIGALAVIGTVAAVVAIKKFTSNKKSADEVTEKVDELVKNKESDSYFKNASKYLRKLRKQQERDKQNAAKDLLKTQKQQERDKKKYFANASEKLRKLRKQQEREDLLRTGTVYNASERLKKLRAAKVAKAVKAAEAKKKYYSNASEHLKKLRSNSLGELKRRTNESYQRNPLSRENLTGASVLRMLDELNGKKRKK